MTFAWRRDTWTSFAYSGGSILLHSIPNGQTYVRVHLRWGFYGDTPAMIEPQGVVNSIMSAGLVTTIGNGTETPPNARTGAGDAAPPTQRWIYWETRAPVVAAVDGQLSTIYWRDSGPTEETQTKGQVLATGVPAGESLNLWFTWAPAFGWDPAGAAVVWGGASILVDEH